MNRPNIVLIMTDTQGANLVGCYGRPELRTPNIDRLASQGVLFSRAHTTCPVCSPARSALFTGLHAHSTGVWSNHLPLGDTLVNMGQRFQDNGYRTGYIGKWHLSGHDYFDTGICPTGWDDKYWYDGKRYLDELSEEQIALWRTGLNNIEKLRQHHITAPFTWGHRISNRAIDFIETSAAGNDPFLLTVSYDEPHGPCTCPPEFVEPFLNYTYDAGPAKDDDLAEKPAHHRVWAEDSRTSGSKYTKGQPGALAMYLGCNSFVDHEIGRVLAAVDKHTAENTMVIYTSDHGDMLGAHGLWQKGAAMYEEITRVPLIVRMPGNSRQAAKDNALVTHIDILPTMLEAAGLKVPPILPGRSLLSRVNTGVETGSERTAFLEFNRFEATNDYSGFQPIRCWMSGDYKLVINLLEETDELYNLRDDPSELKNLIVLPEHAEVRERMLSELIEYMNRVIDPFRGYQWERRSWRKARKPDWRGKNRCRLADGYAPPNLDYDTGKPTEKSESR
jgi:uncharacterized sulfatase